jgi:two-component system, OmpR family, sensor histidine kinase KdpD
MSRIGPLQSQVKALAASALAVATVTAGIAVVDDWLPVFSLIVLYILAVLAVALFFGTVWASLTALASMLAFNYFFLPPVHTLRLADRSQWIALGVFVVTAVVVGTLAGRSKRRAAEAEQREREAALIADVASELLRGTELEQELDRVAGRAAETLGLSSARLDLGGDSLASRAESPYPLEAGGQTVGMLYAPADEEPSIDGRRRLLPALGALLAVAKEREQLAGEALEAETLRRSDAAKTAVLRAVSHDLRTPLATIEAALDGLQSGELVLSPEDRAELLDSIRLEHLRLKRLVEDLLDLSRLQADAAAPALELWPADELIGQALEALPSRARIEVVLPEEIPVVRVDAVQLQRALVNLLENALRWSPPGEPVTVRVNATRKEVLIRVVDRGQGVPEGQRERIFEPFHRLDSSGGAGLGLAIARGFAEANGGRLWVESRSGQGASFALALPAVEAPVGVMG